MLYSPRTNLKPKIIHVSHSVFSVTTYKSAILIRSRTTGDTCIHFANKSSPTTTHHPPLWSHVFTVVQLRGLWEEVATHPRARHAEQILLVSHPPPPLPHFLYMLLLFLPKFGLLGSAKVVVRVLHDWAGDIDGSKRGASAAGDASGIQHIFNRLMQSVRD